MMALPSAEVFTDDTRRVCKLDSLSVNPGGYEESILTYDEKRKDYAEAHGCALTHPDSGGGRK